MIHPERLFTMPVTEFGIVMLSNKEHPKKAPTPMVILVNETDSGMVMLVKETRTKRKHQFRYLRPTLEMVILVNDLHLQKHLLR